MAPENAVILAIMTGLFLTLGYLGVPVAFSLMAGVLVGTAMTPISFQSMIGQMFNGIDSEALMAIPFFLLVGELMTSANVIIRIAELSQAMVGHIRGGLAQVTTVFSMFFSGMSGSSSADVAVLSRTMAEPMNPVAPVRKTRMANPFDKHGWNCLRWCMGPSWSMAILTSGF